MSERSPIAVVTTSFPRHEGDPSGHFVAAHAAELRARGDDVHVVALPGPLFEWPGAAARIADAPWRSIGAVAPCATTTLRLAAYDRVIAHWIVPCAMPLAWLARPKDLEVWAHGADVRLLAARPRLARFVVGRLVDAGARFVFVSSALRDRLATSLDRRLSDALSASSRVERAPIRVPPREGLPDPRGERTARRDPYVVWVGRAIASKRASVAADAARAAGVHLVVIGDGPHLPGEGPALTLLGRLPRPTTLAWIAHASALVSTSLEEGSSTVVREARALGTPVVAFSAGDIEDAAKDDRGIVVVHSAGELTKALTAIA